MIQENGICALIISWWMPGNKNKVKNDNLKYKHFMNKVPWINGSNSLVIDENVSKPHFFPLWHDACIHNRPNINSYFFWYSFIDRFHQINIDIDTYSFRRIYHFAVHQSAKANETNGYDLIFNEFSNGIINLYFNWVYEKFLYLDKFYTSDCVK